jgi:hypothetical protein
VVIPVLQATRRTGSEQLFFFCSSGPEIFLALFSILQEPANFNTRGVPLRSSARILKTHVITCKYHYLSFSLLLVAAITSSGCVGIATSKAANTSAQSDAGGGAHALSASPSSLTFGNIAVGTTSSLGVILTNSGRTTISISSVSVSGAGINASGIPTGTILNPGQSTTLTVRFAPAALGLVNGGVSIASTASNSLLTLSVTGTGVQTAQTNNNAVTSITVNPPNPTIPPGSQIQFTAVDNLGNDLTRVVVWSSSNTSIATVTNGGLATGIADGSVTITATQ